ncbi:MAG: NAD-dependent epimerase/dehydratase family protein [Elusimicrobia bacterium]|nr:NAD-dependent epimerase/dehydratase family protein [Elusimicrobiota bacterium]
MTETKKTVLITGATGFIGRRLASLLVDRYAVRCLVRDAARAKGLLPAGIELVQGDMTDAASLKAAAAGADAVVHLAARKGDEPDIVAVNVGGAHNLIEACRAAGVRRVINIGSQASRLERRGAYGETKARSDEAFAASGLEVTTLVPSLVYGPNDPGVFGKLARVTVSAPFVPVIGDGSVRFQPVHADDVCAVVAGCLAEPRTIGKTYAVGGPQSVTLAGLIDMIGASLGKKPLKVHLPYWAAMGIARVLGLFLASPPLSVSNVTGAVQSAHDADYAAVFAELGLRPRPLAEGLKDALA